MSAGALGGQDANEGAPAVPAANSGASRPDGTDRSALSPAALWSLGVRAPSVGRRVTADAQFQRYEVVLGDCWIDAVLAAAPASTRKGRSAGGQTWVASTPYLVWTPLPYDVPGDGLAFACVGVGSEGCLFIDLAAAPGAVTLGGEPEAATRLAESIAYQLCAGPVEDGVHVVVVGNAVPVPHPPGMEWVASASDLELRDRPGPDRQAELVFCRLNSNDDVFPLARYVANAPYRVVPVILADLPGAPWSFTAHPSRHLTEVLQAMVP